MSAPSLDLRLAPAAGGAWLAAAAGVSGWTSGGQLVALAVVVTGVGVGVWWLPRSRLAATHLVGWVMISGGLAAAVAGWAGASQRDLQLQDPVALWALESRSVTAQFTLRAEPRSHLGGYSDQPWVVAQARLHQVAGPREFRTARLRFRIEASGAAGQQLLGLPVGALLSARVRLAPCEAGEPCVVAGALRGPPQLVAGPDLMGRRINAVRAGLRESLRRNPADQQALVPSLVLGDTSAISETVEADFRATSMTHLMAVSGSNLTLMAGAVLVAARGLGVRGYPLHGLTVLAIIAFVVLCRAEPSVIRAAGMGLVGLAGVGRGQRDGVRSLLLAVLALLVVDPYLSRSWGFALSVVATAGIVLLASRWADSLARWMPGWLAVALAIPVVAQLSTQPLITQLTQGISVVGVFANLLAAPLVAPITVLGLLAAAASLLHPALALPMGWIAGWLSQPLLWIAGALADAPGAVLPWREGWLRAGLLLVLCWAAVLIGPALVHRWWVGVLVVAALLAAATRPITAPGWPGPWQVVACDVGQGDATLLRAAADSAVMIDVGPPEGQAARCVASAGIEDVQLLVLTHFHADHIGGLNELLEHCRVRHILIGSLLEPSDAAREVIQLATRHQVAVHTAAAGQSWQVGRVSLEVLREGAVGPVAVAGEGESAAENNASIMLSARISQIDGDEPNPAQQVTLLLLGDAEPQAQRALLTSSRLSPVDVLKAPHHGSRRQDPQLWSASAARMTWFSAGADNRHGHPHPDTLALAAALDMQVARTDHQGALSLWRDGEALQVRSQR